MSGVTYLSHDSLLYLGALLRSRTTIPQQKTLLKLPDSVRVLRFLHSWRFPEFIHSCTGRPLETYLTQSSIEALFRDQLRGLEYTHAIETRHNGYESLLPLSAFYIRPIPLDKDAWRTATDLQQLWLDNHLVQVLDRLLGGEGRRVATHIIMEAVLNAATHPGASQAFLSAELTPPQTGLEKLTRVLQISVWDDGRSIADTLARQKRRGSIFSPAFGQVNETLDVDVDSETDVAAVRSDMRRIPNRVELLTAAAFMMGVTSLPYRKGLSAQRVDPTGTIHKFLPESARDFGGLGLYLIRRTVLDLFGGSIRYVSGTMRMEIETAEPGSRYRVRVRNIGHSELKTIGNLLLFEIPVRP